MTKKSLGKSDDCCSTCVPPTPSPGWTRCHAYLSGKSRFCRQQVVPGSDFCGHHTDVTRHQPFDVRMMREDAPAPKHTIPCPLDPSHRIVANRLKKHLHVCPARTKQTSLKELPYFREDINRGITSDATSSNKGTGKLNWMDDAEQQQEWAHRVARRVLEIHDRLFLLRRRRRRLMTKSKTLAITYPWWTCRKVNSS